MIPDWLYISGISGTSGTTTISVSAGTNNSEAYRLGELDVSNKHQSEKVIIIEDNMSLKVTPSAITKTYGGGNSTISVSSSTNVYITYPNWITGPISGNGNFNISVSVSQNANDFYRSGNIVFTNGSGISVDVFVKQYPNYIDSYLSFEILNGGNIFWLSESSSNTKTIEISKDNGANWTSITSSTAGTPINVSTGDIVMLRGNNINYYDNNTANRVSFRTGLDNTKPEFNIYGNILSLTYGNNFYYYDTIEDASANNSYRGLFWACYGLIDASRLELLRGEPPEGCYNSMFRACTGLTKTPSLSARIQVSDGCFANVFYDCWNLTSVSIYTPMAYSCYSSAFENCYGLQNVFIHSSVFAERCFRRAFYECKNVNTIDVSDVTSHSATDCTYNWVYGVKASGTFFKNPNVSWGSGVSGIPNGWTVYNG